MQRNDGEQWEEGVFTKTNLSKGAFIGLYRGEWFDADHKTKSDYSFDVDDECSVRLQALYSSCTAIFNCNGYSALQCITVLYRFITVL